MRCSAGGYKLGLEGGISGFSSVKGGADWDWDGNWDWDCSSTLFGRAIPGPQATQPTRPATLTCERPLMPRGPEPVPHTHMGPKAGVPKPQGPKAGAPHENKGEGEGGHA